MRFNQKLSWQWRVFVMVLGLGSVAVHAGPPLICHPFEIGKARSVPWGGGSSWNSPDGGYDVKDLVSDTLELLTPEMPVMVRMETLRRAAIYSVRETGLAAQLVASLSARVLDAEARGKPEALAWFDAGYLMESLKQAGWAYERSHSPSRGAASAANPFQKINGYAWVLRSQKLGVSDPAVEFAAALMTNGPWPNKHFRAALAAATDDSLLGRNLLLHHGQDFQNLRQLRARYGVEVSAK